MPHVITPEKMKGFLAQLAKQGDNAVAKALNKILFQPETPEPGQMQNTNSPPNPNGGADMGSGQSRDIVSTSNAVSPSGGPGGV